MMTRESLVRRRRAANLVFTGSELSNQSTFRLPTRLQPTIRTADTERDWVRCATFGFHLVKFGLIYVGLAGMNTRLDCGVPS